MMEDAMPKEIIRNRHDGQINDDGSIADATFIHLGWSKGHAQAELAVFRPKDPMRFRANGDASFDEVDGWCAQLDRAGINRLIRTLRTARDQAFGRDE